MATNGDPKLFGILYYFSRIAIILTRRSHMKSKNLKSIYLICIIAGGVVGSFVLICFTSISGGIISQEMADFIASVSIPVFYLLGNILHTSCIPFAILLLIVYWAILGIGISCSLVWLLSFILRLKNYKTRRENMEGN